MSVGIRAAAETETGVLVHVLNIYGLLARIGAVVVIPNDIEYAVIGFGEGVTPPPCLAVFRHLRTGPATARIEFSAVRCI